MTNPRHTQTNAADSAPGVDDGRRGASAAKIDSKPGGRKVVLWIVLASLAVLAVVFIARPGAEGKGDGIANEPVHQAPASSSRTAPQAPPS